MALQETIRPERSAQVQQSDETKRQRAPWQVDWKHPRWSSALTTTTDTSRSSTNTSSPTSHSRHVPISISSAAVDQDELPAHILPDPEPAYPDDEEPRKANNYLLSVTLLTESRHHETPKTKENQQVATQILLELVQVQPAISQPTHENPADTDSGVVSQEILASKQLTWPEIIQNITTTAAEADDADASHATASTSSHSLTETAHLPWWARLWKNPNDLTESKPKRGVLSAVLCRSPLSSSQAKQQDAMDVLQSMGLGLPVEAGPPDLKKRTLPSNPPHDSSTVKVEQEHHHQQDLVLACLSDQGLVCIYSPWELLFPPASKDSNDESSKDNQDQWIEEWLLGTELVQRLDQNWLPLSQPLTTISLSVLQDNWNRQRWMRRRQPPEPLWNPWIESSTLANCTIWNKATSLHVVGTTHSSQRTGPYYLVVLGQGIHYQDAIQSLSNRRKTNQVATKKEESEPAPTSPNDKSWWKSTDSLEGSQTKDDDNENKSELPTTLSNDEQSKGRTDSPTTMDEDKKEATLKESNEDENDTPEQMEAEKGPGNTIKSEPLSPENATTIRPSGFVTFCSMSSWSEFKTVFVGFCPHSVHYIEEYHGMELLLCVGQDRVAAIRLDQSDQPVVIGMDDELEAAATQSASLAQDVTNTSTVDIPAPNVLSVDRFSVLPVDLTVRQDSKKMQQRLVCGAGTVPPSILQIYSEYDPSQQYQHGLLLRPTFAGIMANGHIKTTETNSKVAHVPSVPVANNEVALQTLWGHLGQGYCILGIYDRMYFVCWEGATEESFSYIQDLNTTNFEKNQSFGGKSVCTTPILPSPSGTRAVHGKSDSVKVVTEDSIKQDDDAINSKKADLLHRLSTWSQSEGTAQIDLLDHQIPILLLKTADQHAVQQHVFTMREAFVTNGEASPFSDVLNWMSHREDHFTAASIALDLLRDPETLYHLWRNAERIDEEDERSKLNGLLDGIIPLAPEESTEEDDEASFTNETWTRLADMTISCLIKGGAAMSKTLMKFIQMNKHYNGEHASLMLGSVTERAVSSDSSLVAAAMGAQSYQRDPHEEYSIDDRLWPLTCLLKVGVTRDCLPYVIDLLNETIGDEIRNRSSGEKDKAGLDLTKALVDKITTCHESGLDLLLELKDGTKYVRYWESLDLETQQALAMISNERSYPLLRHEDVREWARNQLHDCLEGGTEIPPSWLRDLVRACLINGGYTLNDFILDPTNASFTSIGSDVDITESQDALYYNLELIETRNALEPNPKSGSMDYDLMIPALLILCSKQVHWSSESSGSYVSTQALLDAVCYWTGRRPSDVEGASITSPFPVDAKRLMQQCALSGNVRAGANLVGGLNGFILECCDILMLELQISMEAAEAFFLNDRFDLDTILNSSSTNLYHPDQFTLTDSHRRLLWLLDEHVLRIRTYGEFGTTAFSRRGHVDPILAARTVFRAWVCLTHSCKQAGSRWLAKWLSPRLGLTLKPMKTQNPTHRLACAAIERALLWPSIEQNDEPLSGPVDEQDTRLDESPTDKDQTLLGAVMEMESQFLILLAQSACGLVGSVPTAVAQDLISISSVDLGVA